MVLYGDKVESGLQAVKRPSGHYSIRVNIIKTEPEDIIVSFEKKGLEIEQHPDIHEVLFVKVNGPFKIPEIKKRVVADKFSAESVLQGAHLYAPGIVKCTGLRKGNIVTVVDKYNQAVAVGIVEMDETEILTYRHGLAVRVTHPIYHVSSFRETPEFKDGYIYNQSFPSIVTGLVLDPQLGEVVVDICAALGGKTGHIAQLMQNKGKIIAVDRNAEKVKRLRETITRLEVENVKFISYDARYLDVAFPSIRTDRVSVDPPCSSVGVRPKLFDYTTNEEVNALATYQRQFLRTASKIVKPKGIIVYSTCTMTVVENEAVIDNMIKEQGLELIDQAYYFGSRGNSLFLPDAEFTQRFYPDLHDSPGVFIAKLQKI